jgi:hypothetical protein
VVPVRNSGSDGSVCPWAPPAAPRIDTTSTTLMYDGWFAGKTESSTTNKCNTSSGLYTHRRSTLKWSCMPFAPITTQPRSCRLSDMGVRDHRQMESIDYLGEARKKLAPVFVTPSRGSFRDEDISLMGNLPPQHFTIIKIYGSNNEPEVSAVRKSFLNELVDLCPVDPVRQRWHGKTRNGSPRSNKNSRKGGSCQGSSATHRSHRNEQ